ncbi:MAG: amidohydrolase family protein [Oscillospiraceae bacterium]|nr:amidohydrolase family protein [Oscillospiraceae bacterium]
MINKKSELARRFWEEGRLSDCHILDFHAHMHQMAGSYFPSCSPEKMIDTMKRCNTKLTVFCSHYALEYAEFEERYNLEEAKAHPDYFLAYHSIIPGKTDYKEAIERFEKNRQYYFGFKFHADSHATPLTDAAYAPFLEYMNENHLPALFHTWGKSQYDGADILKILADRYPEAIFICGHSFHGDWEHGAKIVRDRPNMFCELTAVMDNCGAIELLCDVAGSDRILFGTDLPWFDTHHGIGAVLSADIGDDDMRNIFYKNGERLLGRRIDLCLI